MSAQAASAAAKTASSAASAPTRVTVDAVADGDLVYAKPRTPGFGPQRFWANARDDGLSELMARNSGKDAVSLSDRWRGLGGGLLKQLADTGTAYKQTLADHVPGAEAAGAVEGSDAAATAAAAAALQEQALGGVSTNAAEVNLTIRTRSGHTVELKIGVNNGDQGGTRGLQVEVKSSGALSSAERKALADLGDGLDSALEGLGEGAPTLDLSKLMAFDRGGVLSGLDLKVENPNAPADVPGAMRAFSLHLGTDTKSVSMRTTSGEMNLEVDATPPKGAATNGQRWTAIDQLLKQIDAAADRGHADAAMTKSFKDAFQQLQAPPVDEDPSSAGSVAKAVAKNDGQPIAINANAGGADEAAPVTPSMSDGLRSQVQSLQSGLADFKASFSADSQRTSRIGSIQEAGHADYRISQTTTDRPNTATGGRSISQAQTEEMDAHYEKSRTFTLDRAKGNYDAYTVKDSKTVTTLIDTAKDSVSRALRKTDEHRQKSFSQIENFRATEHNEWPSQRSVTERLR
ncbi:hypothetical protein ACQ86G_23195 [Roseateles chitinivorans]|uniref:hypothetical protein n=1 Tax=Roseateles chitinivorans TaxID=2917965 RepID=UPI003D664662